LVVLEEGGKEGREGGGSEIKEGREKGGREEEGGKKEGRE
jgi:hypothetical protein